MNSDEKKVLHISVISEEITKHFKSGRVIILIACLSFVLLVGIIGLVSGFLDLLGSIYVLALMLLLSALWCIWSLKGNSRVKQLKQLDFYLVKDVCIDKKIEVDTSTDAPDSEYYHLYFKENGRYKLNYRAKSVGSDKKMYDTTDVGDEFYLLFLSDNKKRKPEYIFKENEWKLDFSEFEMRDGRYFPRKN